MKCLTMILGALLLGGCAAGTHSGSLHYQNASGQQLNYDYKSSADRGTRNSEVETGHSDTPQKFDADGNPNFGPKKAKTKKAKPNAH